MILKLLDYVILRYLFLRGATDVCVDGKLFRVVAMPVNLWCKIEQDTYNEYKRLLGK